MSDGLARRKVIVHGRVQGVFFRDAMRREADRHGVAGWARNRPDGTVEAVFEGPADTVERLVDFARKGPPSASVERVDTYDEPPEHLSGFSVE